MMPPRYKQIADDHLATIERRLPPGATVQDVTDAFVAVVNEVAQAAWMEGQAHG